MGFIMFGMLRRLMAILIIPFVVSCVYYNLFYNARRSFKTAEQNQLRTEENKRSQNKAPKNRAAPPEQPSISLNDKTLYKTAIDKANRVIVYHPESKYVDDALWIIGKSRYNMAEFTTCDKKLKELVVKYPNSVYLDDGYYYMGMSQFWLTEYDLANEAFGKLMEIKKTPYKDDAAFVSAYIEFVQQNYIPAITSFESFLERFPRAESSATAQFFVGVCHDSLNNYLKAMAAYNRVNKYKPSYDLYFDARFAYGSVALKADSIQLGMSIFENLARQERYFGRSSMIRLKLADGKYRLGKTDEAIDEYLEIIEQFPKTNESAEAYYNLGLIYQNTRDNLDSAKTCFNNATKEKKDSPFYNLALARSAQISKLETYRTKLGRIKAGFEDSTDSNQNPMPDTVSLQDSLTSAPESYRYSYDPTGDHATSGNAMPDEGGTGEQQSYLSLLQERMAMGERLSPADSMYMRQNPMHFDPASDPNIKDSSGIAGISDTVSALSGESDSLGQDTSSVRDDVEIRFLLAELYHHDLNRPDSALNEYLSLAEAYPESEYAPRALLASAFIYEAKKDSANAVRIYRRIVQSYPTSEQARYAVSGISDLEIPFDKNVARLYSQAENMYFIDDNSDSALTLFGYIEANFPGTEYAAKSAFASAWIKSRLVQDDGDSSAYYAYTHIVDRYPETPYADDAKIRLGLVVRESPEPSDQSQPGQEDSGQGSVNPQEDSLRQAVADSLKRTLPRAPAVKDTGEFVWPDSLIREGFKRTVVVIFKIKLDLFGNVIDFEQLGPSGHPEIDSSATVAMKNTTFDMSNLEDLSMLDEYFRYDMRLEPPKYDDFFDRAYENR
jgi:TolA-binding protein